MSLMSPKNVRLVTSGHFAMASGVRLFALPQTDISQRGWVSDAECHSIVTLMRPERFALASFS